MAGFLVVRGGCSLSGDGSLDAVRWLSPMRGCVAGVGVLYGWCVAVVECCVLLAWLAQFVGVWPLVLRVLACGFAVGLVWCRLFVSVGVGC